MTHPDFENLLKDSIGLDVHSIGISTVERAVQSRMTSVGIGGSHGYWEYLQNSSDEVQELIELVVVLETWFFRDREAFSAMIRLISSQWLESTGGPPLRILSVPCCTGEEPYSIVMALLDAGLASERIQVDAVDVSRRAIARARDGVYGSNSFRGEDIGFRDRYLERSGNVYAVSQQLRGPVTFYQENVLAPSFRIKALPYDIIFCRNLLIYLDRDKQEAALATLNRLMGGGGYLFVGPAEAILASRSGFRPLDEDMAFAFLKDTHRIVTKVGSNQPVLKPEPRPTIPVRLKELPPVVAQISSRPPTRSSSNDQSPVDVEQITNLADAGRFDEAAALCRKYLEQERQTFEVYYFLALIHDKKSESERAIECYRKALYLKPEHSEALAHLALLYERQGKPALAKRLRDRALRSDATRDRNQPHNETGVRRSQ
jgi:chemotaxis protein methyltransferase WspC